MEKGRENHQTKELVKATEQRLECKLDLILNKLYSRPVIILEERNGEALPADPPA